MLPCVLAVFLWQTLLAIDQAYLRPGALTTRLGTMHLLEDVMWVHYPHPHMLAVPVGCSPLLLIFLLSWSCWRKMYHRSVPQEYRRDIFTLFHPLAAYVNETISLTFDSFAGLKMLFRPKVVSVCVRHCYVYDVQDIKKIYTFFAQITASQNKAINLNVLHVSV